jgi:hypothetical protein
MNVLFNPLLLFGRVFLAMFKITGYTVVYLVQVPIFLWDRKPSEVAKGFGDWGRAVVDALSEVVRD